MKRIAIFIDGTWNRPDAEHPTNVVRLSRCVASHAVGGMPQVVLYSPGVGSGRGNNWAARRMDRLLGGALGWGLTDIIEEAYRNLVFLYEPGDEIMVFGFSRGAFAARSLVGLIRSCGIPARDKLAEIPEAMRRYRSRAPETHPDHPESLAFRASFAPRVYVNDTEAKWRRKNGAPINDAVRLGIAYLGVWDTVSALGLPAFLPFAERFNAQYRFHDAVLTSMVLAARHAISIDERRKTFPSYPWSNMLDLNVRYNSELIPTHMQQWFPGNHGSVGGGGSRVGLSSISLNWIALGAQQAGLRLDWSEMDRVATHFDVTERLDNKFGPVGLSGAMMSAISNDREGPSGLDELSMAAIDRCKADTDYERNPSLRQIYHEIHGVDDVQRDSIRKARKWADGGHTHLPDEILRPREWL
ncbi:phospholipase effector Tle1 domain-containing protein [Octadecabacter ascidiaceicola]|uniref:T6SS Phospholipase effector Tle1-like catalytic domain-containing protein n=1 Tax=Octadecabacter ascidiaceicola TaxID=1655543 RepID=A0A238JP90_9RHOB|nr:DUF2235 domain-containing protein [Octadecabacter ascidiaceicola]SMX32325.1 hypothetical protein OCA8868_00707 [Octadecabacter ascidiaceicola]